MRRDTDEKRRTIALNGTWQFVTDPDDAGRDEGWADPDASWPERDRDRALEVEIPHSWQELEAYRDYTGRAWYRRTVSLETASDATHDGDGDRTLLRFGAVDYEATVWVNGERVGANRGGYLPFAVDATDALVDGENTIVVEVVDPDDISEIPHGKQGAPWYQRVSGIWQDVTLEVVPALRLAAIRVTPDLETDTARVDLEVSAADADVSLEEADVTATVRVTRNGNPIVSADATIDANGPDGTTFDARGTGTATFEIPDPDYWTPETPALYDVTVDLERDGDVVDRDSDYFGMRSIESRDGRVYLNGEPYFLRGALDQGYYPKTLYRPFADDLFEREVRLAKELGFNLLRKHIKPAHPDFLECADRQGLLVWEEPANPTVHTERSKREVREQLHGMIERDYNRPSVVVWSLYNEEWGIGNPQGLDEETSLWEDRDKQASLADLYEETRERDPTRLVCDNSGWAHVATDVNDYHRYFVSPDRAGAWERDLDRILENPGDNYAAARTDPEDAPLVVSEFGTWGLFDVPAVEDFYDGRPPWFDHEFLEEGLKRPAGYRERFEATTLPDVFGDLESLAEAWQWREFRSIADVIERMRARDGVAGYVITEFSDIEWEFNGILDYRREEKAFHEAFARVNAPVAVQLDLESRSVRAGETVRADAVVVNDTAETVRAELSWTAFGESGRRSLAVEPSSRTRLDDFVEIDAPSLEDVTTADVALVFGSDARTVEPVTVVPSSATTEIGTESGAETGAGGGIGIETASGGGRGTVYTDVDDADLATALERRGSTVTVAVDDLAEADAAVVTETTEAVLEYARDGGAVLLVPDADGVVADEAVFDYRRLSEDESWNLVASLFYTDDDRLEELFGTVPGWELEGLYPYTVADATDADDVSVGSVEGWLANWSAAIATRNYGEGSVRLCTFRVADAYGTHPMATVLLDELLDRCLE
ncbi:glycoside hydrolase family 2 protein [Halomontanus rarus]|uniref:glycoside hydrolase family 2 protein n=1 Tax=Halomontanus rarus TaxID=3034020 RepID=UPI0023E8A094|nr:sugar-binding domain-containing protein [Halovivax sp. TS33]